MKEAYGGIFNLAFIVIFLVIAIGVLGLTFSYTKAFKMKSAVVSVIEEYEGSMCSDNLKKKVQREAVNLGYSPTNLVCPDDYTPVDGLFCYKLEEGSPHKIGNDQYVVYHVVTQFDIHFPIIEKMMNIHFFQVRGDTEEIYIQKDWKKC